MGVVTAQIALKGGAPAGAPTPIDVDRVLDLIAAELERAAELHGPIRSVHELVGILLEEHAEFQAAAFVRRPDHRALREELVQIAAVVCRGLLDLGLLGEGDDAQ